MTVTETELEMLELFLDGELTADEAARLSARFETEPALVEALARLTAERDARRTVWGALEPSEAATDRLVRSIRTDIGTHRAREQVWVDRSRMFRRTGLAAACLMFAFTAGWLGRGNVAPAPSSGGVSNGGPIASNGMIPSAGAVASNTDPADPLPGQIVFDPRPVESVRVPKLVPPPNKNPQGYLVRLTDNTGQQVGVQRFATLEEAQRFADNFRRLHQENRERRDLRTREAVAPRESTKLIKEEF